MRRSRKHDPHNVDYPKAAHDRAVFYLVRLFKLLLSIAQNLAYDE